MYHEVGKGFGAGVLDANVCGATRVWGTCSTSGQCPQRGGLAWPVGIMQEECIFCRLGTDTTSALGVLLSDAGQRTNLSIALCRFLQTQAQPPAPQE
jgi:hypothetical protein